MKQKDPTPDIYRVVYRASRWKSKSIKYFTAFSTDEAIVDYCYSMSDTRSHSSSFTVIKIERYDRFADRWDNCTGEISSRVIIPDNVIFKNKTK